MKQFAAMEAWYRFTRTDGQPISLEQRRTLDDSLFELIGTWVEKQGLAVEGEAQFEVAKKPPQ